VWVVLFGLSYSAESLAHAMFPGLAIAAVAGLPLVLGGAGGLAVAGVGIALAARVRGVGPDNAVAVVITSLFGLGALLALSPAAPPGLGELLFGDVLAAGTIDLILAAGLAALVLAHWRLLVVAFDATGARALGISPLTAELALLLLLALAVLVGVQGLGNLLVVAALVAPAAAARTITRRIGPMVGVACALGVGCGIGGLYLSYYASVAAGAAIAGLLVVTAAISGGANALRRAPRPASGARRTRTAPW
jgi:ABC-type Mn2+/Zn2+ transport system permease subunit